jgi:hypothetical protein
MRKLNAALIVATTLVLVATSAALNIMQRYEMRW